MEIIFNGSRDSEYGLNLICVTTEHNEKEEIEVCGNISLPLDEIQVFQVQNSHTNTWYSLNLKTQYNEYNCLFRSRRDMISWILLTQNKDVRNLFDLIMLEVPTPRFLGDKTQHDFKLVQMVKDNTGDLFSIIRNGNLCFYRTRRVSIQKESPDRRHSRPVFLAW